MTSKHSSLPTVALGLGQLAKLVQTIQREHLWELFEIHRQNIEFRRVERTMSVNAFMKVSRFASLCDKWEKQGNLSTLSTKKAFRRWMVRTNREFGHDCIERVLASCRKTPKNVSMVLKIIVRKQTTLKKRKFLQFSSFLAEKLEASRQKILHSNKSFFFFAVCLIAGKKKNEELSRIHNSFVHLLNFRLGQNGGLMVSAVLGNSPKALLLNSLRRAAHKKAFDALQSLRVFTKKTNFITSFKFVDLVQSKILANFREVFQSNQPFKRRFLELMIAKIRASIRRVLRQLDNRSMMIRNQRLGMDRFANLIRRSWENATMRNAWNTIRLVCQWKESLKVLDRSLPVLQKLVNCEWKAKALRRVAEYAGRVQEMRKEALVKSLVLRQTRKARVALTQLAAYNRKHKDLVRVVFKGICKAEHFRVSLVFERLVTNRLAGGLADQKKRDTRLKLMLVEKLTQSAKLTQVRTIRKLERFNAVQKRIQALIATKMKAFVNRQVQKYLQKLVANSRGVFAKEQKFKSMFRRQLNYKYREALEFGWHGLRSVCTLARSLDAFGRIFGRFLAKKDKDALRDGFGTLRENLISERIKTIEQRKERQKWAAVFQNLQRRSRTKCQAVFSKLQGHQRLHRQFARRLISKMLKASEFLLHVCFKRLQKNKDMFAFASDQEKRKIRNFRIANALLRMEETPKRNFLDNLKAISAQSGQNEFLLRKTFLKMHRHILAVWFSRLIECVRFEKMQEIDKMLAQTRNDLSQLHRQVRPQLHKMLIKNVFLSLPEKLFAKDLKISMDRMKGFAAEIRRDRERMAKISAVFERNSKKSALNELRLHSKEIGNFRIQATFRIYCLEVMFRGIRKHNLRDGLDAVIRENEMARSKQKIALKIANRIRAAPMRSALDWMRQFALNEKKQRVEFNRTRLQRSALEGLRDLEGRKRRKDGLLLLQGMEGVAKTRQRFGNTIAKAQKRLVRDAVGELVDHHKESVLVEQKKREKEKIQRKALRNLLGATDDKLLDTLKTFREQLRAQNKLTQFGELARKHFERNKRNVLESLSGASGLVRKNKERKRRLGVALDFVGKRTRQLTQSAFQRLSKASKAIRVASRALAFKLREKCLQSQNEAFTKLSGLSSKIAYDRNSKVRNLIHGIGLLKTIKNRKIRNAFDALKGKKSIREPKIVLQTQLKKAEKRLLREALGLFRGFRIRMRKVFKTMQKLESKTIQKLRITLFSLQLNLRQQRRFNDLKCKTAGRMDQLLSRRTKTECLQTLRTYKDRMNRIQVSLSRLCKVSSLKSTSTLASLRDFHQKAKAQTEGFARFLVFLFLKKRRMSLSEAAAILRGKRTSHKFKVLLNNLYRLGGKSQSKMAVAFSRLKRPEFRKQQVERGLFRLSNRVAISQFETKYRALAIFRRMSPLAQTRVFRALMLFLAKAVQKSQLTGFLVILGTNRRQKKHRNLRPEKLAAIRFVRNFVTARNAADPQHLKYPCFLKLTTLLPAFKASPTQELTLQRLENYLSPKRPDDYEEKSRKLAETKFEMVEIKSNTSALQFGNRLLLEKNQQLMSENKGLEEEATKLKREREELDQTIRNLYKETGRHEQEVLTLTQECEKLKEERETLRNEQKMIEERLLAMDPNFDLNASKIRGSVLCNSVDNLRASNMLLGKAARERKDLEDLLGKYQEETRALEEEIANLEKEELEVLARAKAIQKEKEDMEKKLKEKNAVAGAMEAENEALKRENQNALQLLSEARKAQAALKEGLAVQKPEKKDVGQLQELVDEKVRLLEEIGKQDELIEKKTLEIERLGVNLNQKLPENATAETQTQLWENEVAQLKTRQLQLADNKILLNGRLDAPKKELANLVADRNYLVTQLKNHQQNKLKFEKELENPGLTGKNRQMAIEKVNQMQVNMRVIGDNIEVNEKSLAAETEKVKAVEAEIQTVEAEVNRNEQAIEARQAAIRDVQAVSGSIGQLTAEKRRAELLRDKANTEVEELDAQMVAISEKPKTSKQADHEQEKALERNRQQIVQLEALILSNQRQIEHNEARNRDMATDTEKLQSEFEEQKKRYLEVTAVVSSLGQRKGAMQIQKEDLDIQKKHDLDRLTGDSHHNDSSDAPEFLLRTGRQVGKGADSNDFRASIFEGDMDKLYQPSDFVPNDYSQVLKSETAPSVRRKLTNRLTEIRANLKSYGKDIEVKDEYLQAARRELTGKQTELTNINQIFGQKVEAVQVVEGKIERNETAIEANKRLFETNAIRIQSNKEAIDKNYKEIQEINDEFKRFTSLPVQEAFLAAGRPRDVACKKMQTNVKQIFDSRVQTDLDNGDIENLEKRARQKHIVKVRENPVEQTVPKTPAVAAAPGREGFGAQTILKDLVNFAQTQNYNASFRIERDLSMADNKLFEQPRLEPQASPQIDGEFSSHKGKADFGKKNLAEMELLAARRLQDSLEGMPEPYPGELKPDHRDTLSFVKRAPPFDSAIFPEIELLQSQRLKCVVCLDQQRCVEPPRRTGSTENLLDFNSVLQEESQNNMEMSFGNFEAENPSVHRKKKLGGATYEIDNIFEYLMPKGGPEPDYSPFKGDSSPMVAKSMRMSMKFANHSRQTNVKKLAHVLAVDQIIRAKNTLQVCQAFADLGLALRARQRADDRLKFGVSAANNFSNKKSRIQFQLKALKEFKATRNKRLCATLRYLFDQRVQDYYHRFASNFHIQEQKTELTTTFRRDLEIAKTVHVRQMGSIRKAKGTFDGILSRTIFRRLNQAFHRIFDYSQKRNQNFFKRFVPVIVRADENMKNLLMDVLQYWYNVRGESNWTQRIIQYFVHRSPITEKIGLLRLKMFRKKPSRTLGVGRELAQKLSVAFSGCAKRCLAEVFAVMKELPRRKIRKTSSANLSDGSAQIEVLKDDFEDSEREDILKKYELVMSQQELKLLTLNTKVLTSSIAQIFRRHLVIGMRFIMPHRMRGLATNLRG